jgi:hypothetical protein
VPYHIDAFWHQYPTAVGGSWAGAEVKRQAAVGGSWAGAEVKRQAAVGRSSGEEAGSSWW